MADNNTFAVQPTEMADATKHLDALADRVQQVMGTEAPNLTVTAAGKDEVSQQVAATLNEVHDRFGKSTDAGVLEIREIAATMRQHNGSIVATDQELT